MREHSNIIIGSRGNSLTVISLIFIVVSFCYHLYSFANYPPEIQKYFQETFIGRLSSSGGSASIAGIFELEKYVFFFVGIHLIRIHFGLNFIAYDTSFAKVLSAIPSATIKNKKVRELILRLSLIVSLQMLNVLFWNASYWIICTILIAQGVLIFLYNFNYWTELFQRDKEHKANYFILVGDFVFLVTSLLLVFEANFLFKRFVIFLVGGYTSIFIGEFISQYTQSIVLLARDIQFQLKNIV